jgi:hypothetical protein
MATVQEAFATLTRDSATKQRRRAMVAPLAQQTAF